MPTPQFPQINGKMTPEQLNLVRTGQGGRPYVSDDSLADHLSTLDPTGFGSTWARAKREQPRFQSQDGTDIPYSTAVLNNYVLGKYDAYVPTKTKGFRLSDIHPALKEVNPFGMTKEKEAMNFSERLGSVVGDTSKSASPLIQSMGGIIKDSISDAASGLNEAAADYGEGRRSLAGAIYKGGSEMAFGAARSIGSPLEAVAKPILEPAVKAVVDSVQKDPGLLAPLAQALYQASSKFAADNPMAADIAESTAKWASLPLAVTGIESTINSVGAKTAALGKGAVTKVSQVSKAVGSAANSAQVAKLEKLLQSGKNPPVEEVAKYPDLFHKYSEKYGIKQIAAENVTDDMALGGSAGVDNVEGARLEILNNAKATAGAADVQKSVMPPTTKKVFQEANANMKNEGSFFKAPSLNPTESQVELAKVADSLKGKGFSAKNSPIANEKVAQNSWASESKELLGKMKANDALSPDQEIVSAIKQSLEKQGFATDTGVGKKVLSAWEDALSGNSNGKISGQWQSKINFSQEATRKWGNAIYDKGTDLADAVNASHEAANGVISVNSARAGIDYTGQMARLTKIHKIIENLKLQQSGDALRSTAGNIAKSKPFKLGATAVGLGAGLKLLP